MGGFTYYKCPLSTPSAYLTDTNVATGCAACGLFPTCAGKEKKGRLFFVVAPFLGFILSPLGYVVGTNEGPNALDMLSNCSVSGPRKYISFPGSASCQYTAACLPTTETGCQNPMQDLAHTLCGSFTSPSSCSTLQGVFQFMGHLWNSDSACGVVSSDFSLLDSSSFFFKEGKEAKKREIKESESSFLPLCVFYLYFTRTQSSVGTNRWAPHGALRATHMRITTPCVLSLLV